MNRSLGQIGIKVGSMVQARQFYGGTLGLEELFVAPNVAGYDLGGIRLLLVEHEGFTSSGMDGATLYLCVKGIEEEHAAFLRSGARDAGAPHRVAVMGTTETWVGFVADPFGNVLGLIEDRLPA